MSRHERRAEAARHHKDVAFEIRKCTDNEPLSGQWLIDGFIMRGEPGLLKFNPVKEGVAALVPELIPQLIACVANGAPFQGRKTEKCTVFYVNYSMGVDEFMRRSAEEVAALGAPQPGLIFHYNARETDEPLLYAPGGGKPIEKRSGFKWLEDWIDAAGAHGHHSFVLIDDSDKMGRITFGADNEAESHKMQKLFDDLCVEKGCTILTLLRRVEQ